MDTMDDNKKLWIDCSQVESLGIILSSSAVQDDDDDLMRTKIDMLAVQYEAILQSYKAIQENFATVASDVAKIKRALNIDVPSPQSKET